MLLLLLVFAVAASVDGALLLLLLLLRFVLKHCCRKIGLILTLVLQNLLIDQFDSKLSATAASSVANAALLFLNKVRVPPSHTKASATAASDLRNDATLPAAPNQFRFTAALAAATA